jgi:hypothetical protein
VNLGARDGAVGERGAMATCAAQFPLPMLLLIEEIGSRIR